MAACLDCSEEVTAEIVAVRKSLSGPGRSSTGSDLRKARFGCHAPGRVVVLFAHTLVSN
jgi:hypothetical protein